jgi:hypothetical protein
MYAEYTAAVKKSGKWWIEEIPGVNCQESTHEELTESLRVTLKEALEFNRQDTISAINAPQRHAIQKQMTILHEKSARPLV